MTSLYACYHKKWDRGFRVQRCVWPHSTAHLLLHAVNPPPDIGRSTAQFFRNREYFLGLSRFVCVSVTRYWFDTLCFLRSTYRNYSLHSQVHCTRRPREIRLYNWQFVNQPVKPGFLLAHNVLDVVLECSSCWSWSAGLVLEQWTLNIKLKEQLQFLCNLANVICSLSSCRVVLTYFHDPSNRRALRSL